MPIKPLRALATLAALTFLLAACAPTGPGPADKVPVLPANTPMAVPADTPPVQSPEVLQTAQAEAFSASAPLASDTPSPAQRSQTPTDAAPPPSAGAAQPAGQQVAMQQEAFLAGPPAYAIMNRCEMPGPTAGPRSSTWTASLDLGLLCLFGFGEGEVVRYEVQDAVGQTVAAGEAAQDNMDGDPLPSVKIMVGIAANAPGVWTVRAQGTGDALESHFDVQPMTLEGRPPVLLILPGAGADPLRPGSEVAYAAYGMAPGSAATVGVYEVAEETATRSTLRLRESVEIRADDTGRAHAALAIDSAYKPGGYCIVLAANPTYEPTRELSTQGATRCFEVK